ncbi:MAG TPA: nucleotide exchange factor GrpE, partial [Gammaproteobacteria bacterium]
MSENVSEKPQEKVQENISPGAETQGGAEEPGNAETVKAEAPLEEQLEVAQKKAQENWELALRAQAELENLRKRTHRDIENAHKYALEKLATELLGVRDSMELGLSAAQESKDIAGIREGMQLTLKMLAQVMEKFDIREIHPEGEKFNPELHQAMAMQETDKLEPNNVISVMQKG